MLILRLPVTTLLALFSVVSVGVAHAQTNADVDMEHVVLHRDNTMYYIGDPSLAVLDSGEIVMGLREAPARLPGEWGHVDPMARGILLRSRDNGRTFGEKRVVDDESIRSSSSQSVTLTRLSSGNLIASIYSWGIAPVPTGVDLGKIHTGKKLVGADKPFIAIFEGLWTRYSVDGGKTWSDRRTVNLPKLPPLAARAPMAELDDGTLLLQANDLSRGVGAPRDWARVFCLRSSDGGKTWSDAVLVADGRELRTHFLEPSLIRLRSGRLISMLRTRGEGRGADERVGAGTKAIGGMADYFGYLFQTVSDDDGRTWSEPKKTPMWGFPGHILELEDGRLLCTYSHRRKPFGIRGTLSLDGGKTWNIAEEIIIRDDGGTWDMGYPCSIQLPDGKVLVAYYFDDADGAETDRITRHIAGTFLEL